MADTPAERTPEERAALYRRIPAYALLRATITHDHDAAVLIVSENTRPDLLVFEVAAIAARVHARVRGLRPGQGPPHAGLLDRNGRQRRTERGRGARQHRTRRERARRGPARGPGRGGPGRVSRSSVPTPRGTSTRRSASWPAGPPGDRHGFAATVASSAAVILTREAAGDRDGALRAADAALEVSQGLTVREARGRLRYVTYLRTQRPVYGPDIRTRGVLRYSPASASAAGEGSAVVASGPP